MSDEIPNGEGDACTYGYRDVTTQVSVENNVVNVNRMLDHLIEAVRHHRNGDQLCPVYCMGEHFRSDIVNIFNEPGGIQGTIALLHYAVSRLAGVDTR